MVVVQAFVLSLVGLCLVVRADPWIVTQHVIISTSEWFKAYTYIDGDVDPAVIQTYTLRATPTVSPLPTDLPLLTVRPTRTYDSTVTSVFVELPPSLGATVTGYNYDDNYYYVDLVYTAPSSCFSAWTYTTSVRARAPDGASPPYSSGTVYTSTDILDIQTTVTERIIQPTELPEGTFSSLSSLWEPLWVNRCTIPAYATGSSYDGGSGGRNGGSGDITFTYDYDDNDFSTRSCRNQRYAWYWVEFSSCLSLTQLVLILFFSIFGFFFLAGLVQNLFSFVSLCKGRSARRGIPWLWSLLCPILSCLCLLGSSSGFAAKSPEEQAVLRQRWSQLPFGTKFKQWLTWGFRRKYPPFLGPPPSPRGVIAPTRVPATTGMVGAQVPHQSPGNNMVEVPAAVHASAAPMYSQQQTQFQVWDSQTQSWQPWTGGPAGSPMMPAPYQASHYQERSQQNVSTPSEVSAQPASAVYGTAEVIETQPKAGSSDVRDRGEGRK